MSRLILGPFYEGIAEDVAATAPVGGRVLEVGCGPGHVSIQLAQRHGLDVTGIDLDPNMIGRARHNASHESDGAVGNLSFQVADVGSLPYPEESFDLVVSTLSMHHWADPTASLTETSRVLRPGGKALIWDFRPGRMPFHIDMRDPIQSVQGSPLTIVKSTPWQWPWNLALTQRIELAHPYTIDTPDRVTPTTTD